MLITIRDLALAHTIALPQLKFSLRQNNTVAVPIAATGLLAYIRPDIDLTYSFVRLDDGIAVASLSTALQST